MGNMVYTHCFSAWVFFFDGAGRLWLHAHRKSKGRATDLEKSSDFEIDLEIGYTLKYRDILNKYGK